MKSRMIIGFRKFNEEFLKEDENEFEILNAVLIDLMELEYQLNREVEEYIESGSVPSEQEVKQRLKTYYLLSNLNSVSTRVSQLYNQLYMLKGE